jgi:hypothetical protein
MKKKLLSIFCVAVGIGCLTGCYYTQNNDVEPPFTPRNAYKPIYATNSTEAKEVRVTAPAKLEKVGKIYYKDNFIFINENNKGVHIINNSNPAAPQKVAFLNIRGCTDIVIKNNLLYANNLIDLVVLDVTNPLQATLKNRIENAFLYSPRPPQINVSFICPDASKGIVVGWEIITSETERKQATCF